MNLKILAKEESRVRKLDRYCSSLASNFASLTACQQYITKYALFIL